MTEDEAETERIRDYFFAEQWMPLAKKRLEEKRVDLALLQAHAPKPRGNDLISRLINQLEEEIAMYDRLLKELLALLDQKPTH